MPSAHQGTRRGETGYSVIHSCQANSKPITLLQPANKCCVSFQRVEARTMAACSADKRGSRCRLHWVNIGLSAAVIPCKTLGNVPLCLRVHSVVVHPLCPQLLFDASVLPPRLPRVGAALGDGRHLVDCRIISAFEFSVSWRVMRTLQQKDGAISHLDLHSCVGSLGALYMVILLEESSRRRAFSWLGLLPCLCCVCMQKSSSTERWLGIVQCNFSHVARALTPRSVKYNPPIRRKAMLRGVGICACCCFCRCGGSSSALVACNPVTGLRSCGKKFPHNAVPLDTFTCRRCNPYVIRTNLYSCPASTRPQEVLKLCSTGSKPSSIMLRFDRC